MISETIIDVRTPAEFNGAHVAGSINIPLQEIPKRISEIKAIKQPVILCCASGVRSAQATKYLSENGIPCENGGGWMEVNNRIQSKTLVTR